MNQGLLVVGITFLKLLMMTIGHKKVARIVSVSKHKLITFII